MASRTRATAWVGEVNARARPGRGCKPSPGAAAAPAGDVSSFPHASAARPRCLGRDASTAPDRLHSGPCQTHLRGQRPRSPGALGLHLHVTANRAGGWRKLGRAHWAGPGRAGPSEAGDGARFPAQLFISRSNDSVRLPLKRGRGELGLVRCAPRHPGAGVAQPGAWRGPCPGF